jgi:hypothetical protein
MGHVMKVISEQGEFFGLVLERRYPFRLRPNDVIRVDGRLGLVIRVNECAAVVLMNRQPREFNTRFDKHVRFQPSPVTFRISVNSETEILNRKASKKHRQTETKRRIT